MEAIITIVGFLGTGKTSLLNHILHMKENFYLKL
ncbi:GTP-binding protein [Zobellia sp. 1_MG-2023]